MFCGVFLFCFKRFFTLLWNCLFYHSKVRLCFAKGWRGEQTTKVILLFLLFTFLLVWKVRGKCLVQLECPVLLSFLMKPAAFGVGMGNTQRLLKAYAAYLGTGKSSLWIKKDFLVHRMVHWACLRANGCGCWCEIPLPSPEWNHSWQPEWIWLLGWALPRGLGILIPVVKNSRRLPPPPHQDLNTLPFPTPGSLVRLCLISIGVLRCSPPSSLSKAGTLQLHWTLW